MSGEERCERTDLLVSACDHCRPKAPSFPAIFAGDCATCEHAIRTGQMIRDRGDGRWEHASHAR